MMLRFEKFTGAGNDFVIINNPEFFPQSELIQKVCDRHFGVGADGVILIDNSDQADFRVRYFNSDGSGDALCVNGARCAALFAYLKKLCDKKCSFEFLTEVFQAEVIDEQNVELFIHYSPLIQLDKVVNFLDRELITHFVDIKSKHLIIYWDYFSSVYSSIINQNDFETFDIEYFGRLLRNHPAFLPDGVNVNFVKQIERDFIRVRTYERGVEAETLACGSGSIASSIIFYLTQKINPPVNVLSTSQKIFKINFKEKDNFFSEISIQGHAQKIFEGMIELT